jgi:hypothetical protein
VDPNLKDENINLSLRWAVHGWCSPPEITAGKCEIVRLLFATGAKIETEWMESEKVASSPAMLAALRATDGWLGRLYGPELNVPQVKRFARAVSAAS